MKELHAEVDGASARVRDAERMLRICGDLTILMRCDGGMWMQYWDRHLRLSKDQLTMGRPMLEVPALQRLKYSHFLDAFLEYAERKARETLI